MSPPSKFAARLAAGQGAACCPGLVFSLGLIVLLFVLAPPLPPLPPGYTDHLGLAQFRRRFQVLDPLLMKKLMLASEGVDERKVCGTRGGGGPVCFCSRGDCPGGHLDQWGWEIRASGPKVRVV